MNEETSEAPQQADLDVLKTLNELAFERWAKRREYEWKLSFGLWTAIAAFVAIVLGKDNHLSGFPATLCAITLGLVITTVHALYLYRIFDGTLGDLDRQDRVEKALWKSLSSDELKNLAPPDKPLRYPRHGILQAAITLVLCMCAVAAIYIAHPQK
jgi:hypothetical protein